MTSLWSPPKQNIPLVPVQASGIKWDTNSILIRYYLHVAEHPLFGRWNLQCSIPKYGDLYKVFLNTTLSQLEISFRYTYKKVRHNSTSNKVLLNRMKFQLSYSGIRDRYFYVYRNKMIIWSPNEGIMILSPLHNLIQDDSTLMAKITLRTLLSVAPDVDRYKKMEYAAVSAS